jgi:hypothetical protein
MPEDRQPIYQIAQRHIVVRPDVHVLVQALAEAGDTTMGQLVARAVTMYGEQMTERGTEITEECGTEIAEVVALQ